MQKGVKFSKDIDFECKHKIYSQKFLDIPIFLGMSLANLLNYCDFFNFATMVGSYFFKFNHVCHLGGIACPLILKELSI